MAISWNLTRVATGEVRSLQGWGIKSPVRALVNQGTDSLALNLSGNDLLGNSPFDLKEILRLDRVVEAGGVFTSTTVLLGPIISEPRSAYGASEGLSVALVGPWWYLEQLVYTQLANFATDVSAPTVADAATGYPLAAKDTSQILFAEDQTRSRVDSRFMIIEALNFAIAKGVPLQYGVIDPGISMPRESISDVTCAAIILRSLKWTPGQSLWFDYTTDPPTLYIRERENRPLIEIDLNDKDLVAEIELNPRFDLLLPGVTINYLRRHQRYLKIPVDPEVPDGAYTLSPLEVATLDQEQAGPDPTGIGALILTIELFGSTLYQTAIEPPTFDLIAQEDAPEGIAALLYAAYSTLQFEGRISLVRAECDDTPWIGRTLKVLNGNPAWNERLMDIRQAEDNIFSGRTELSIGPSLQLGPGDLLDLLRKGKTIPPLRGDVIIRDIPSPVPTVPPIPPIPDPGIIPPSSPPHEPPPDTEPHVDLDPTDYITSNLRYSGTILENSAHIPWPPGGVFGAWIATGVLTPPYTLAGTGVSGIFAALTRTGRRTAGPGVAYYIDSFAAEGEYTLTTFDFRQFSIGEEAGMVQDNILSMWLVGTKTLSKADGSSETSELKIEISAGIGGHFTYRASANVGATCNYDDSVSFQVANAYGSVALGTLRIFTRPPH